jgi:hypothetical protein
MTVFLLMLLLALLVVIGYGLALYRLRTERQRLQALRQVVAGEFVALQQVQRISDVYLQARAALRRSRHDYEEHPAA